MPSNVRRTERVERRHEPRHTDVQFVFSHDGHHEAVCAAQDASQSAARFALDAEDLIKQSNAASFELEGTRVSVRLFRSPTKFRKKDSFVLTYRLMPLELDTRLHGDGGDYRLAAFIGGGRSGATYTATRLTTTSGPAGTLIEQVVIKIPTLPLNLATDDARRLLEKLDSLFRSEWTSLDRLTRLNSVAQVLDHGGYRHPLGGNRSVPAQFIVQERIDGVSLDSYLSAGANGTFDGLAAAAFVDLALRLATAVHDIHSRLVVHGDIWPENILMRSGQPVIIDFGQAILREVVAETTPVPGRNSKYEPPEKIKSVRGDIYSLGAVLFYLATGEDPPKSPPEDIDELKDMIVAFIRKRNRRLYDDNCGIADVIAHCMRRSSSPPFDRVRHAQGVIEHLETFSPVGERGNLVQALGRLQTASQELDAQGNPLFQWMASRRVASLASTIEENTRGVYDLIGGHHALVKGLTEYLSFLEDGDFYLTSTIPQFWLPRNLGVNGRFISEHTLAAKRGAKIKRLFLLTSDEADDPSWAKVIDVQRRVIKGIKRSQFSGTYEARVRVITPEIRDQMLRDGKHFGVMIKRGVPVAIYPEYGEDGSLIAVRFRAGQNLVGGLEETFSGLWNEPGYHDILTFKRAGR